MYKQTLYITEIKRQTSLAATIAGQPMLTITFIPSFTLSFTQNNILHKFTLQANSARRTAILLAALLIMFYCYAQCWVSVRHEV